MPDSPILVLAVDFATHADEITLKAVEVARQMGARLRLLHVVSTGPMVKPDTLVIPEGSSTPIEALELLQQDARDHLRPLLELMWAEGVQADLCLRTGDVVSAIAGCVDESRATMVVIGSDIPTGLRKLIRGSVTEAVIERVSCPVLVVRAQGAAAGLSAARQQVQVEADG